MDEATYVANYITNGGDKVIYNPTLTLRTTTTKHFDSSRSTLSISFYFTLCPSFTGGVHEEIQKCCVEGLRP